jgi:hypothetical protein
MPRWTTTVVGIAVVVLIGWVVIRNAHPPKAIGRDPHANFVDAQADSLDAIAATTPPLTGALDAGDDGSPLLISDFVVPGARADASAGTTLLDGAPVPPLPLNAPRQVRFGVVLVSYAGAQPSPASAASGGRPPARPRAEARSLAEALLSEAQKDFHGAVERGDPGSADDVGRVKIGILEPAPEYVLFTLPVAGVGGPVETPRGYWIVKRLE